MMLSWPFSPRLALVFDFTTRGRNCLARAFGYPKSLYGYCAVKFAGQNNLGFANFVADDVGLLKGCKIHDIAFDLRQFIQANFCNITLLARRKAKLRQTASQRLLTTLKTRSNTATRTGFQTFVTTATGFTETASDTTSDASSGGTGTGFRTKFVQTHLSSPQPEPGNLPG